MTRPHSLSTRSLAALAVSLVLLTGCTADPKPSPSPTPTPLFASKKDAFAAAEATYRAYNDAGNATVLTDARTFEDVYKWLRADALSSAKKAYSYYDAEGWRRVGETTFDHFTPISYDGEDVTARLCIDVSHVDVLDSTGASVVSPDRQPRQALELQLKPALTSTGLAIVSSDATKELEC
ncbi:hypothetical protein [Microbacterium sufflavum]